jgi:hypothetical protein
MPYPWVFNAKLRSVLMQSDYALSRRGLSENKAASQTWSDGSLELLKWIGLVCMTLDHINKYLLGESNSLLYTLGRIAMPLFVFVLGCNLARPNALANGIYGKVARRLSIYAALASIPFVAMNHSLFGWWPLNILVTLLMATLVALLLDMKQQWATGLAIAVFVFGGLLVEFWWPSVGACLFAWAYIRRPTWPRVIGFVICLGLLYFINRNHWALVGIPVIYMAQFFTRHIPRVPHLFYIYYPAHLMVIWAVQSYLS